MLETLRCVAFDFGMKKIGSAAGQTQTKTTQALQLISATDGIPDWDQLDKIIQTWQPDILVLGIPLNMDGTEQPLTLNARKFGKRLRHRYKRPVCEIDERLTTREARERVVLQQGAKALKQPVDCVAAQILLENWFDQVKRYGLIGAPVLHSPGPEFHNRWFNKHHIVALYQAWHVESIELSTMIPRLKSFVHGLSVTMPHKEAIIPYLDHLAPNAQAIGAVNTIVVKDKLWHGYNTDGEGAIQALDQPIANKVIHVLGAGGAARAIIYTACEEGATVRIFNRDVQKAADLCRQMGAEIACSFDEIAKFPCDILINTLPFTVEVPIPQEAVIQESIMDITHRKDQSWLLSHAERLTIRFIDKMAMFQAQAILQQKLWGCPI